MAQKICFPTISYKNQEAKTLYKFCFKNPSGHNDRGTKKLPCITFCPVQGFKSKGHNFDLDSYVKSTFSLEDIFDEDTVEMLRNQSLFEVSETFTVLMGRCHTLCSKTEWQKKSGPKFMFNTTMNFVTYVHVVDESLWLNGFTEFPFEVAVAKLNLNNDEYGEATMRIYEIETTVLIKRNEPCKEYAETVEDNSRFFHDCCRQAIADELRTLTRQRYFKTYFCLHFMLSWSAANSQAGLVSV